MHRITGSSFNEVYVGLAKKLIANGNEISPKENKTLELCNVMLCLANPKENLLTIPSRNYDFDYLRAEIDWYNSCSLHVDGIKDHASIWSEIADDGGFVNSNYGYIMMKQMENGFTQWEWCKMSLEKDLYTRQAVINFNQPRHKYIGNKDFVCTLSMQFLYRNGQLDCIVHMRSNDFIYGLAYDLPWFTIKHIEMARDLNLELGNYYHMATSMHVYKKHFKLLKSIASEKSRENHE